MTRATLLFATLLAAVSVGAVAQETMSGSETGQTTEQPESGQVQTFTELDTNSDGMLDEDEVANSETAVEFIELDQDGDGEVNRNEYFQYHRQ